MLDARFTDRALAAVRLRKVASRALVYEHHFHDISMSPSISSHAHTSDFRSSLQPERIPATSAGLVRVKLCVESFINIHIASLLRLCTNFRNVGFSLARSMVFRSLLATSSCFLSFAIATCALARARSKVLQEVLMCALARARSKVSQCCSNMSRGQILEFRFLDWNYRHSSHVVVMIVQHRDDHERP